MLTVTSGEHNTAHAGELFDSGLTALITPSKSFSHKFMHPGEFSYFCRVHPTMVGSGTSVTKIVTSAYGGQSNRGD